MRLRYSTNGQGGKMSLEVVEASGVEILERLGYSRTRHRVTSQDLADHLNSLSPHAWGEPYFLVKGRNLEIDPDDSDLVAAKCLGVSLRDARTLNNASARWLSAGGCKVALRADGRWEPVE